jgi:hypothetical protein
MVPLAWEVDPPLALALRARYPTVAAIAKPLEALVLQHANEPRVGGRAGLPRFLRLAAGIPRMPEATAVGGLAVHR